MNRPVSHEKVRGSAGKLSSPGQLAAEMKRLSQASTHDLQVEWRRFYRTNPPDRLSRDGLLLGVLYKVHDGRMAVEPTRRAHSAPACRCDCGIQ